MARYTTFRDDDSSSSEEESVSSSSSSSSSSESDLDYSSEEDETRTTKDWGSIRTTTTIQQPVKTTTRGRSRYALFHHPQQHPPKKNEPESMAQYKRRCWGGYDDDRSADLQLQLQPQPQRYPALQSYRDAETVPTDALLRLTMAAAAAENDNALLPIIEQDDVDVTMNALAHLLEAVAIVEAPAAAAAVFQQQQQSSALVLQQQQQNDTITMRQQQQVRATQQRLEAEHAEAADALSLLLTRHQQQADQIVAAEERLQQQQEQADQDRKQRLQQQAAQAAQKQAEDAAAAEEEVRRQKEKEEEEAAAAAAAAAPPEYVLRAQKLTAQLIAVQASVEPFDTAPAVAKRRLPMKKIVNGRVNTLSESVDKIRQVAEEVLHAINQARQEDEAWKAQSNSNPQQYPPELARGKRYLVNLLSSKVIVRAQAEGFNGQRGDGFPLANMLAQVSVGAKDLVPVLTAHLYTVCPTAIPSLPHPAPDATEDQVMESLGMLRKKDGEFESFERFLSRTEGVISLVADIMASEPSTHTLLGGHEGAIKWIARFLDLLPPAPQAPLPLLTAPVLDAFLTGTGHMLANQHGEEFRQHLNTITQDIVNRLDESPIGMPSATRLKKTVGGGFDGFRQHLPSRALPALYYGASGDSLQSGGAKHATTTSSSPFASASATATAGGPFASSAPSAGQNSSGFGNMGTGAGAPNNNNNVTNQSTNNNSREPCKFFAQGRCNQGSNCRFSHESAPEPAPFGSAPPVPSPFGGKVQAPNASSFSFRSQPSPFGNAPAAPAAASPFGVAPTTAAASSSPFGGTAATGASPFGSPPAPAQTPNSFGGSSSNIGFPNPAPTTPFGGGGSIQQTPASTPFGGGSNTTPFGSSAANPSPFGAATQAPNPSPFGAATQPPDPSPFGGTSNNPAPFGSGGFGQTTQTSSTPFGGGSSASPFGALPANPSPFGASASPSLSGTPAPTPVGFGGQAPTPSPFGNQPTTNQSPFGAPSPFGGSPPPFGAAPSNPSPFGASPSNPSPFGAAPSNQSPFGAAPCNQSPFGAAPSPFGGQTQQQQSPFGPNNSNQGQISGKAPCKFFAQGNCRFGNNCRFSHESGSAFSSNPFGGPRR